ncbi:MAG: acyltransferase family protein [Terrimicrobiaceae bacterium]|nr:acyltransferase family protein [Terrimicrobiaceae bacterium]
MLISTAFLFGIDKGLHPVADNILLALGLAVLVPCNCPAIRGTLETALLLFLGRLSYSIYLLHLPVLMLTWSLMARWQPAALEALPPMPTAVVMFVVTAGMTIPLAWACERFVERPLNTLGHRWAAPLAARPAQSAAEISARA